MNWNFLRGKRCFPLLRRIVFLFGVEGVVLSYAFFKNVGFKFEDLK